MLIDDRAVLTKIIIFGQQYPNNLIGSCMASWLMPDPGLISVPMTG